MAKKYAYLQLRSHNLLGKEGFNIEPEIPHILSNRFTQEEYKNLLSGVYGHRPYSLRYEISPQLANHRYNTPKLNSEILNALMDHHTYAKHNDSKGHDSRKHVANSKELIESLVEKHHLPEKDVLKYIDEIASDSKDATLGSLIRKINEKSLTRKIYDHIASDPERHIPYDHPFARQEHVDSGIDKIKGSDINAITNNPRLNLSDDQIEKILHRTFGDTTDKLLDKYNPEKKSELIDKLLGITDGEFNEAPDTYPDADDNKYNNWNHGQGYKPAAAESLATSKHLNIAQIEHIKHHGTFDEKIAMFQNPNIDPAIQNEMFTKWVDDDDGHGYERDEFKDWIKENHQFDYDDYREEAEEQARENYSLDDYLRDSGEKLYSQEDVSEKAQEVLDDQDWTGPNPDFDDTEPESEDNPKEIDFNDHRRYSMNDHPDFEDRQNEAESDAEEKLQQLQDDGRLSTPDHIWEGYDESNSEDAYRIAQELHEKSIDNFDENDFWIPSHLQGKLTPMEDLRQRRIERKQAEDRAKAKELEEKDASFVNQYIPNKTNEFHYGSDQRLLELAKDHADANGGKIDIGYLSKKYPNSLQKWKQIFGQSGSVSSADLESKINNLPKEKYNISYGRWDHNGLQNTNGRNQTIIRLDRTPEYMDKLKASDPAAYNVMQALAETGHVGGIHPANHNTVGWARVDMNDPKHWFVEEIQSDFSKATRKAMESRYENDLNSKISGTYGHLDMTVGDFANKITDIENSHPAKWQETLMAKVIAEAKAHGVDKISTHSPESKAVVNGADKIHSTYKTLYHKLPRDMGFFTNSHENLPLTKDGIKYFKQGRKEVSNSDLIASHEQGMWDHSILSEAARRQSNPEALSYHQDMFRQHLNRLSQIDPTHGFAQHKTSQLFFDKLKDKNPMEDAVTQALSEPLPGKALADAALKMEPVSVSGHTGHTLDLRPESFRKSLEEITDLLKSEISQETKQNLAAVLLIFQNKETMQQIAQQNPQLASTIEELVQLTIDSYKKITGKEDMGDILAIANEMKQQPQGEPQDDGQGPQSQPQSSGMGRLASKDPEIHAKQTVYAPGTEREYSAQSARTKTPDGEWVSNTGKPVDDATSKLGAKF